MPPTETPSTTTSLELVRCARCDHATEVLPEWACPKCTHRRYYTGDVSPVRLARMLGWPLMAVGVFGLISHAVSFWFGPGLLPGVEGTGQLLAWLGAVGASLLVVQGGLQLTRLESRRWAMFTALIAMLPCSPACFLGIPVGVAIIVALAPTSNDRWFMLH